MTIFSSRVRALIIKELLTLLQDPKVRLVLIGPPLFQLFIFSFAATLEVKHVSLAVYNQENGRHGQEIVYRLSGSTTFSHMRFLQSVDEFPAVIDQQKAIAVMHIPQDFSRSIESGGQGVVQLIMDGRRSNAAQIVSGYITQLVANYGQEIGRSQARPAGGAAITQRSWFNENLLYMWFTVPSLVGVLAMLVTLMVTALSVAREKELGTFDQLLVSPLMPHEILLGKTVPAVLVGYVEGLLIVFCSIALFRVPFTGSFLLLCVGLLVFVLSVVGMGLFISALSKTQQQAILGAFCFMVPSVALSGFAAPVENMPVWLQHATWANPLKHGLIIFKGLFLKDLPATEVWACIWPLLIIGTVSLVFANWFFTRRLE